MELKTLKDIEAHHKNVDSYNVLEDIKQEAIKRVKHWQLRVDQMENLGEDENYSYFKGMRDEAKIFANITDEDLNDAKEVQDE